MPKNQSPFTIILPIQQGHESSLRMYLQNVGNDIRGNTLLNFDIKQKPFDRLHYCCFVIVKPFDENNATHSFLVFEGNIDGPVDTFLPALVTNAKSFFSSICGFCQGYTEATNIAVYLSAHNVGATTFYVGAPGRTVHEILEQEKVHVDVSDYLDKNRGNLIGLDPCSIRRNILSGVPSARMALQTLSFVPTHVKFGQMLFSSNRRVAIVLLCIVALFLSTFMYLNPSLTIITILLLAIGLLVLIARLRYHESNDRQISDEFNQKQIGQARLIEDRKLQNHLTSISIVKPGLLRHYIIRIVLHAVQFVARYKETHGSLAGITTIHFARWVLIDGGFGEHGKRVLFLSNYDGSWEHYLGEFIDHASVGLTAIWSNTCLGTDKGFPSTSWLGFRQGGARDEQRFKFMVRDSQLSEQIWYSAYPNISMKNILNNHKIFRLLANDDPKSAAELLTLL